ncbi:hypothetical protein J0B02_01465 [Enterobacteriaceae bacterium YMB-R22]|jgi:hypothetical protein|nr:hypothetical protein [Tenebrionicola larvae]MBV4411523.1 hypothetical protein [Tenebrionicola larvae]
MKYRLNWKKEEKFSLFHHITKCVVEMNAGGEGEGNNGRPAIKAAM